MVDGEPGSDGVVFPVLQTVSLKLDRQIILAVSLHSLEAGGHEPVSKMPGHQVTVTSRSERAG